MVSQLHFDLEVVAANDVHKYPYHAADSSPEAILNAGTGTNKIAYESTEYERAESQTICGLRKKTFWILLGVALVIVAGAVG